VGVVVGVAVGGTNGTMAMAMIVATCTDAVSSNSKVPLVTVTEKVLSSAIFFPVPKEG
jgi:hypothetical protein